MHARVVRRLLPILAGVAAVSQARAQGVPADSGAQARFDIPAQPLGDALAELARRTGLRITAPGVGQARVRSADVAGTVSAAAALRAMLEGTGFVARFADAARVTVAPVSGAAPRELRAMVVTGNAARRRGYATPRSTTAMKTDTPLRDAPQSVSIVGRALIADQAMQGMQDVVRYVPGIQMAQGEGHRDAPTIRGNNSTADFFVDGVRDDAQYLRDLYNVERVEALKGSNAMIFGRGGGGGVINRVTKDAQWLPTNAVTLEGGSFDHKRGLVDAGRGFGTRVAGRVNGVYEKSDAFRDQMSLRRYGVNPTATLIASPSTTVRLGYEYFDDARTVDRGIPSFRGRPEGGDITTFFGNPDVNRSTMRVHHGTAAVEHAAAHGITIRNRTRVSNYDKFYQNTFPGAVDSTGTKVALSAYNHAIERRNLFNQTDVTMPLVTGFAKHALLVGAEAGRQHTDQFRNTGYFNNSATSLTTPLGAPTITTPVTFRQSATDADNATRTTAASTYAQDQIELGEHLQLVGGVRLERFAVSYQNHRVDQRLRRDDWLVSPRAGIVAKPMTALSFYGSYSRSYLPSSGDQFTALTVTSSNLEPERFTNRELGAKWDATSALSLTAATYRLDRTNTSAPDPTDASKVVQTGAQRTTGLELGATGDVTSHWQVAGGFAAQRARIVSTTSAAKSGQSVALVPNRTFSLWNRYQIARPLGVGFGIIHQSDMYAAIDNTVTLPSFTRADAALFAPLGRGVRAQLNIENLFDTRYYATSQGNNNIMPGAPRTVRVTLAVE